MSAVKQGLLLFLITCFSITTQAQSDSSFFDLEFRGYLKSMQTYSFAPNLSTVPMDNLVHNRLNLRVYGGERWQGAIEVRNRLMNGFTVEHTPGFAQIAAQDRDWVDMSWAWLDKPHLAGLSTLDRLWVEYRADRWEVRLGRQRINWGINMFWNSNDLFNAYSFVDFDYEERPGSDAVRAQFHLNNMNRIELAVKPGKNKEDWTSALLYRFNKWQYDFQVLSGLYGNDFTVGGGWAGNLKSAGFKGEATYFHSLVDSTLGEGVLSTSVSVDFLFGNQLFLTVAGLYNSAGLTRDDAVNGGLALSSLNVTSAKSLMPTQFTTLSSLSYPITELLSASLVGLYAPGLNMVFLMPSLGYSVATNWELSLFGQSYFVGNPLVHGHSVYMRWRWSF